MEKITDYLLMEIETESGKKFGRVFDVRSEGEPEHGIPATERLFDYVLYGRRGLWETLGFKQTKSDLLPWSAVKRFEDGKMIVEDFPEE
jgi:hypothetical protein